MDEKKTSLVEKITLTSVPADQRKSWPSIAFIWAGSVICIPALLVGSLISAGMNFKQSALCMVIGYVLVVFYMCLMGIQSSDLGLPATVAISRAYGKRGSSFLVWHPSLSYFARDYGLHQIALGGAEHKEVSIPALREAIEEARGSGASVSG